MCGGFWVDVTCETRHRFRIKLNVSSWKKTLHVTVIRKRFLMPQTAFMPCGHQKASDEEKPPKGSEDTALPVCCGAQAPAFPSNILRRSNLILCGLPLNHPWNLRCHFHKSQPKANQNNAESDAGGRRLCVDRGCSSSHFSHVVQHEEKQERYEHSPQQINAKSTQGMWSFAGCTQAWDGHNISYVWQHLQPGLTYTNTNLMQPKAVVFKLSCEY